MDTESPSAKEKTHQTSEQLIFPNAIVMVSIMLDETSATKIKAIPLLNTTVAKPTCNISCDLVNQLIDKLKNTCIASG